MGRRLPLFGLDSKASDARLLATWLAAFQGAGGISESWRTRGIGRDPPPLADLHREAVLASMGDASADFLGLRSGGCHYVPPRFRLDSLHQRAERSNGLCDLPFRLSRGPLPPAYGHSVVALPRARHCRVPGPRRNWPVSVAQNARPRCTCGSNAGDGFLAADLALRHLNYGISSNGFARMAGGKLLRFHRDSARNHRNRGVALSSFRQVLSYLPAASATGCEALSEGRRGRQWGYLLALWRTLCLSDARRRFEESSAAGWLQLFHVWTRWELAGSLSSLQAQVDLSGATETQRGSEWLRRPFRKRLSKSNSGPISTMFHPAGGRMNPSTLRKSWLKPIVVSADSNAASSSRFERIASSASSPGKISPLITACFARKALSAICKAAIPTAYSHR